LFLFVFFVVPLSRASAHSATRFLSSGGEGAALPSGGEEHIPFDFPLAFGGLHVGTY